jgi:hypothetical protein
VFCNPCSKGQPNSEDGRENDPISSAARTSSSSGPRHQGADANPPMQVWAAKETCRPVPLPRGQRVLAEETSGGSQTVGFQAMFPAGRYGQETGSDKEEW